MLYCTAEASLDELFFVNSEEAETFDEAFAFDRTKSRMMEMQSELYFQTKQHKFYKPQDEEVLKDEN